MSNFQKARALLEDFKGDTYLYGDKVLKDIGKIAASIGNNAALIRGGFSGIDQYIEEILGSLTKSGVQHITQINGARPNAPREDLARITKELTTANPDMIISFGGGSTIDTAKVADVLRILGGEIEDYFGLGLVTEKLQQTGKLLTPHISIQTAASSGAHLTKYSNITEINSGQKKLVVDDAITPGFPVFDYTLTHKSPKSLTDDGALDGLTHLLEVLCGTVGTPQYDKMKEIAEVGISLIVEYLPELRKNPENIEAREAICLATDLGAYAIMIGSTNGAHLTSFSFVDILSHGRACALMNPYYIVFFAPVIEQPLNVVGKILKDAGYIKEDFLDLKGRALGVAVTQGLFCFAHAIDFPTTLNEVAGFTNDHIVRALAAAKNPQLKMKLESMPIPLTTDMIDKYMTPILEAAKIGDISLINNV